MLKLFQKLNLEWMFGRVVDADVCEVVVAEIKTNFIENK